MKIVVLAGGLSPERNVSLSTGTMVAEALRRLGHRSALVDLYFGDEGGLPALEARFDAPLGEGAKKVSAAAPDLDAVKRSRKGGGESMFGPGVLEICSRADLVFLALHGSCGEDGRVQAAFDLMGIPYTGSGYLGSAMAMDKDLTKRVLAGVVDTPAWQTVENKRVDPDVLSGQTPLPCVVKPVDSGSSIGVTIAHSREELRAALEQVKGKGGRTVLEQYVKGREIQVAILDGKALPSIEIIPLQGFYDYANKYQPGAAREVCPAPISPQLERKVGEAAVRAYERLGLAVYSRADFILDEEGRFWFLEINTLPGMTPTSLVPQEASAVGMDYDSLCSTIVEKSLEARQAKK